MRQGPLLATIAQQEEALAALERSIAQLKPSLQEAQSSEEGQTSPAAEATQAIQKEAASLDESIDTLKSEIKTLESQAKQTTAIVTLKSGTKINASIPKFSAGNVALYDKQGASKKGPIAMIKEIQFRQDQALDTFPEKKVVKKPTRPKSTVPTYTGPPLIDFKILRSKKTRTDDNKSGYLHEKRQNFKYTMTVQSKEMTRTLEDLHCYLFVVGENLTESPQYKMLIKENKKFSLDTRETLVFESKEKEVWYDDIGGMYGAKYYGYLAVVTDKEGSIIIVKRSKSSLEKAFDKLKNVSEDSNFSL